MKLFTNIFMIALFAVIMSSCSDDNSTNSSKAGTFSSTAVTMGSGTAKSWVTLDNDGNPTAIGITLTEGALQDLPDSDKEYMMMMPMEAAATNIQMVMIDWNHAGHEPEGVYDIPHFDFHFYMVDDNFLGQITATGDDTVKCNKQPAAGYIAPDYMLPPGGVPHMGNHAVDMTSGEWNGVRFDKTFIYGYYDGSMIFYEPMITREYLLTNPNSTTSIKVPIYYPKSGYYPTNYTVVYDASAKTYTITLTGMVKRTTPAM